MKHYSIDYSLVYEASCDLSRAYEKLLSDDMEIAKVLIGYAVDKLDRFTSQDNLVEDYDCPDPLIKLNETCILTEPGDMFFDDDDENQVGSEEEADTGEPQICKDCPFSDSTVQPICKSCEHNVNT